MPELPELPDGIAPDSDELPELPPGYVYGLTVSADAEVIHSDGTKD